MSNKWISDSEIVAGYVLKEMLDPNAVNLADVHPSYQHIVTMKRDGASRADIVAANLSAADACLHAAETINGNVDEPVQYLKVLARSAIANKASVDMAKVQAKIDKGEMITAAEIMAIGDKLETGYNQWVPMSTVEPQKTKFVPTGYEPLDKHTIGIPYACVTLIGGNPGVGKSTLGFQLIESMIKLPKNKKKKAAIISLEMTMGQVHQRYIEISKALTKEDKSRILLNRIFNIHEIKAAVTQLCAIEDLCVVMIDFADLIMEGEQTEAAMGVVYREMELLATKTEIPIVLIVQLNRESYKSGIPRIHHIRYTSLAESTARMILMAYDPNSVVSDFSNQDKDKVLLPAVAGRGYIIVEKSNFGYKEGNPGAIVVDRDGEKGWGHKSHGYIKMST